MAFKFIGSFFRCTYKSVISLFCSTTVRTCLNRRIKVCHWLVLLVLHSLKGPHWRRNSRNKSILKFGGRLRKSIKTRDKITYRRQIHLYYIITVLLNRLCVTFKHSGFIYGVHFKTKCPVTSQRTCPSYSNCIHAMPAVCLHTLRSFVEILYATSILKVVCRVNASTYTSKRPIRSIKILFFFVMSAEKQLCS